MEKQRNTPSGIYLIILLQERERAGSAFSADLMQLHGNKLSAETEYLRTSASEQIYIQRNKLTCLLIYSGKECPYTYLDCVAAHARMIPMIQRMPTDFSCFIYNNVIETRVDIRVQ